MRSFEFPIPLVERVLDGVSTQPSVPASSLNLAGYAPMGFFL